MTRGAPAKGQLWYNDLIAAIESLRWMPQRCPTVQGVQVRGGPIRQLEYGRRPHIYRVYFRVVEQTVEVLEIRHRAQSRRSSQS